MGTKVVQVESLGEVRFSQNSRSRRIRLSVRADRTILVSFPVWVTFREAAAFMTQHTGWIRSRISEKETRWHELTPESVIHTRYHTVAFEVAPGGFRVTGSDGRFRIGVPGKESMQSQEFRNFFHKVMTAVYRQEAIGYLPGRTEELARQWGFRYNRLTIRNNRSNWGSCSAANNISLNLQLMQLPDELTDFILLHELVHTKVKNHGPDFWRMLDGVTGGQARRLAREIKKYSPRVGTAGPLPAGSKFEQGNLQLLVNL